MGIGVGFDGNDDGKIDLEAFYSREGMPSGYPYVWFEDVDLDGIKYDLVFWDWNQDGVFDKIETIDELEARETGKEQVPEESVQ